jgi:hypothetical protein
MLLQVWILEQTLPDGRSRITAHSSEEAAQGGLFAYVIRQWDHEDPPPADPREAVEDYYQAHYGEDSYLIFRRFVDFPDDPLDEEGDADIVDFTEGEVKVTLAALDHITLKHIAKDCGGIGREEAYRFVISAREKLRN